MRQVSSFWWTVRSGRNDVLPKPHRRILPLAVFDGLVFLCFGVGRVLGGIFRERNDTLCNIVIGE